MSGAVDVHGLRVEHTTRDLTSDLAARFLGAFPEDVSARAPDLALAIVAGDPGADAGDAAGFRPSFFHGNIRGLERDGEIRIVSAGARLTIPSDGRRIDAIVDERALDERTFVDTTLVMALAVALRHAGLFHLHAGAVVRADGRRVLVLGDGGSGKSTVTLALIDADARHLGDDTLFFARRDGRARLLAFPRAFHLGPATARAFPALASMQPGGEGKHHVAQRDLPGTPTMQMDAPHVLLFPQVTRDAKTRAVPLSKADAFGLALRSCALVVVDGLPNAKRSEQLELLRELFERSRAFEVLLGGDWLEAPSRAAQAIPWAECPA